MKLTKSCAKLLKKHGGTILAVAASVGVVLTAVETGKATVKAQKLIEMNTVPEEEYTTKDKIVDCYKFYIPAAVLGAGTIACILGSNALNKKQIASLTAAYMALGKTYQEYRKQVVDRYGADIDKDIWKDAQTLKEKPLETAETEKLLCYEPISKRYFHATEAELTDAFYNLNRDFALDGEASMNDFCNYLGLDHLPELDTMGWCADYLANEWEYFWVDCEYYKQTTDDGLEVYYVDAFQPPIEHYIDYDPYEEYCEKKKEIEA